MTIFHSEYKIFYNKEFAETMERQKILEKSPSVTYHDNGILLLDTIGLGHGVFDFHDDFLCRPFVLDGRPHGALKQFLRILAGLCLSEGHHLAEVTIQEGLAYVLLRLLLVV